MKLTITKEQIKQFKRLWPCSGLPDWIDIEVEFASNGDLVDIVPDSTEFDGPALAALIAASPSSK